MITPVSEENNENEEDEQNLKRWINTWIVLIACWIFHWTRRLLVYIKRVQAGSNFSEHVYHEIFPWWGIWNIFPAFTKFLDLSLLNFEAINRFVYPTCNALYFARDLHFRRLSFSSSYVDHYSDVFSFRPGSSTSWKAAATDQLLLHSFSILQTR